MDNDDNDYQGSGIHLVGEESSKVSPAVRPFTLPKFDFDVGQLRFDNLVENEVFLGIPSQEDNQWIEDFSRGGSGLEFSSAAADSCSIPRHNNVWSEATSSETVEMLLKSVGQEEMAPVDPPVQHSDGHGELTSLTKDMDGKIDNSKDANTVVGPIEAKVEFSKANKSSDAGDAPDICMAEAHQVDVSASGPPVTPNDTVSQDVTDVNMQTSCDDGKKESVFVNETLKEQIKDDSSTADVEVPDAGIVQDATPIIQKTDEQVGASDVYHESATSMDLDAKDVDNSDDTCSGDLPKSVENLGKSAGEITTSNIQEARGSELAGDYNITTGEGHCEEKGVSKLAGQAITQDDDLSVMKQPSSSSAAGDTVGVTMASLENTNETSAIHGEHTSAPDLVPAHTEAGSADIVKELSSHGGGLHGVHDNVAEDLPSDSSKLDHDSAGPLGGGKIAESPLGDVTETKLKSTDALENDGSSKTEKGTNFEVEETSKTSPNTVHHDSDGTLDSGKIAESPFGDVAETKLRSTDAIEKESNFEVKETSKMSPNTVESWPSTAAVCQIDDSGAQVAFVDSTNEEAVPLVANQSANSVKETSVAAVNVEQAVHETSVEPSDANMDECVEETEIHKPEPEELPTENDPVAAPSGDSGGGTYAENEIANTKSEEIDEGTGLSNQENFPVTNSKELVAGNDPAGFMPQPEGVKVAPEEEKSFTFDVIPSAGIPEDNSPQSITQINAQKISMVLDGSPSTPLINQKDPEVVQDISSGIQQTPGKGGPSKVKGTSVRKSRRVSAKSGKETAKKRKNKDTVPVLTGSPGGGQLMQIDVGAKKGVVVSSPGSSFPDQNSSSQTSLLFQQPFTDQQQVELRAQIFVYGSLIQGVAPDESCMLSAFGISDRTRSWEPTWRACLERLKSHPRNTETPIQSSKGSKALERSNKKGSSQIKLLSTPVGQASNNTLSPSNPMIPLSSPLWNISTPSCDAHMPGNLGRGAVVDFASQSPVHPYQAQTPTVQNFSVNTSSWPSQGLPPSSWVSSTQSSAAETRSSTQSVTEAQLLTPIMESSDVAKTSTQGQYSTEKRSRKRKKSSVGKDVGQSALSLPLTGTTSIPMTASDVQQGIFNGQSDTAVISHTPITSHFSTSVAVATPSNFVLKSSLDQSLAALPPITSMDHTKHEDSRLLKPEDVAKVEEAKLQAEEAAGHAAAAVTHCQNVWCQLDKHKNSGLMSDAEARVASAAAAIAASASIAKAAAAAAKIASNVALHAKLMIDETLVSDGTQNSTQAESITLHGLTSVGNATPASTLKVGDGNIGSSSIIFAAREAAKKKLEAASAASRHAENVEAMVKAAELAAEAVSQAGKVAAMVDTLPIAKLVEAGPEGYLKDSNFPSGQGAKSNNTLGNISNNSRVQEVSDAVMDQSDRPFDNELHIRDQVTSPLSKEMPLKLVEDQNEGDNQISAPITRGGKDLRSRKKYKSADLSKTSDVVSESEATLKPSAEENVANSSNDNGGITEGCLVEVFKDNGDFTGAWFSANVLSLKGGKASVSYTDLGSNEGSEKLKEWVPLGAEDNKQPIVRLAHPLTTFDGTRKRRRADARDITWSNGDRVDAWIENGWREGMVIEKNKKDETTLNIHFPAQGNTAAVRAWHLRPTLVWKDGEWIEWSTFRDSSKGDSPQEKRQKLGSSPIEGKGKGKLSKNTDTAETQIPLPLAANEKVFNMGTKNENKPEGLRTKRSGLQKEGSKVIFGVPKPGKKRKFMDVSKHYVSSKGNAPNDSDKLNKSMIPQGSGTSRPWRNATRVDPKERQAAELNRLKTGLKSGRHPNLSTRSLPRRDNSNALLGNGNSGSTQQNQAEFVSSSNNEESTEEEAPLSSQVTRPDAPKKAAGTSARTERLTRGRLTTPAPVKSTKVEVKEKPVPEPSIEQPRRSNRRIQPTSRLLEGLQSQITISKFPSSSHDKSQKNRGISKGNH